MIAAALPALILSLAVVTPNVGSRAMATDEPTQAQLEARDEQYRERINELLAEGKSQIDIDRIIADEFDIVRLNVNPDVSVGVATNTTASNLVMYTPTFSYDRFYNQYVMAASWAWKICPDYHRPCWANEKTSAGTVGGPDGMAVKINRAILRKTAGISTNNNCGDPAISNNQPDTDTGNGIAFIEQDAVTLPGGAGSCLGTPYRYNWHRGTVSERFIFANPNCGGYQLQIDAKIGHTWSSTSVNSIGISTSGISFSWSSSNYRWNAIPATPGYAAC
jgi:hypothetical protein